MIRGSVLLAACVGLWSCSSDPTADEAGVPDKIVSLPSVIFVKQDSSELVAFQLVDALDGQIPTEWTVTANSPLFSVAFDSTFRPVYNPDGTLTLPGQQTEARATLTGVALGVDTLTVTASGKTLDVIVNVVPGTLHVTFSPANPAPGDTVTMTMPPELRLSPTSAVTFTGNQAPIIVDRAADSTSLRFISAPTTATNATVTQIYDTQFPALPVFTLNSETKVIGTMSGAFTGFLPATFSTLTPAAAPVIMTMDPGFGVMPTTVISFTNQTPPIINNANVTGDSTVVNFSVGPNVNQKVNVTKVYAKGAPQFLYTLESSPFMVSPVILNFPATLDITNPKVGQNIVLTAGAGYSFTATATPTFGAAGAALIISRTATTLTVQPVPGSAGAPSVTGVVAASAPAFVLTLPASLPTNLAMQNVSNFTGQGAPATAPAVVGPGFYDLSPLASACAATGSGGGAGCQYYKITVPAAGAENFSLTWNSNDDLGLYFMNSAFVGLTPGSGTPGSFSCDAKGNGAAGHPETCTVTFAAAGTYYLEVADYGPFYPPGAAPTPTWIQISLP
jgi:hypothetical protein